MLHQDQVILLCPARDQAEDTFNDSTRLQFIRFPKNFLQPLATELLAVWSGRLSDAVCVKNQLVTRLKRNRDVCVSCLRKWPDKQAVLG